MKRAAVILFIAGSLLSCSSDSLFDPEAALQIVVQAYLYAGEPVNDIRLTETLPLGSEDSLAPSVNDADVAVIKNGIRYQLITSPGDSGYYHYPGTDLFIEEGDDFQLDILYDGESINAETTVPPAPENCTISVDTLAVPESMFEWFQSRNNSVTVRWQNNGNTLFFVLVENVEENPQIIDFGFGGGQFAQRFRFLSRPTPADSMQVNMMSISHLGKHRIKVYRVNQEYADLYISRNQDSRDLNEPLSNIQNGLGVFSAFNSDSLFFYVRMQ